MNIVNCDINSEKDYMSEPTDTDKFMMQGINCQLDEGSVLLGILMLMVCLISCRVMSLLFSSICFMDKLAFWNVRGV